MGIEESVEHVILHCQKFSREREVLREESRKLEQEELSLKNFFDTEGSYYDI